MSALDFLSLDGARGALSRSSMHRRLEEAGAEFAERGGWLIAVRVPGEERHATLVRDVTHLHRVREGAAGAVIEFRPPGREPIVTERWWNGGDGDLLDVSAGSAALEIAGPAATAVLRRMTELDLSDLPAVGQVAHTRAWVVRDGEESYRLVFPQEYGHYLWEVAVDAAEPLGGGPGGTP